LGVSLRPTEPANFYLTVKELNDIVLSGSGDIELESLTAGEVELQISGSGHLDILGTRSKSR